MKTKDTKKKAPVKKPAKFEATDKVADELAAQTDHILAKFAAHMKDQDASVKIIPQAKKEYKVIERQIAGDKKLAVVVRGRIEQVYEELETAGKNYIGSLDKCAELYKEQKKEYALIVKSGKQFKKSKSKADGKELKDAIEKYVALDNEFDVQAKLNEKSGKLFNKKRDQFTRLVEKHFEKNYGIKPKEKPQIAKPAPKAKKAK